mgnify:CR=1 FL=1
MLSEAEIQQFQQDGVLIVRNLLSPEQVAAIKTDWQRARQAISNQGQENHLSRVDRFVFGRLPATIQDLYKTEALVKIAQQLLREANIALYMTRLLIKDADWNGPVANHQDMPAFHGTMQKLSAFVPLQPHNPATGGLKVVKGSQRYGNLGVFGTIHLEAFPAMEIIEPSLDVGDVMFVDFLTWHYSEEATEPSERPLLQIAYQSAEDGAYYELEQPTLVAGEWKTEYFTRHGHGVTANAIAPGSAKEVQELTDRLAQVQQDLAGAIAAQTQAEREVQQLQAELNQALNTVQAMKSSKFWKLRGAWTKLKKTAGLGR